MYVIYILYIILFFPPSPVKVQKGTKRGTRRGRKRGRRIGS